ncbi:DsbA family oxidoreductase [Paractinoplanes brasiliensis]|uniref:Putative DsbA family dithiol-disulfide isomerase n=1 Tax=Paractinoplanes brasiliensis TaxID=52695 RepID=A0A4R6JS77_9ACTN|nr:DsbA family oxidoreductase [Actinoplanes brasiliensis]TDO39454.1 putative DsbA family dithiol-disulfide isomerase [Actinoplanes brasiliensis]GID32744.1 DSBA oxidoreductase [Actinoplanes brasiliensis]
MDIQVWSDAVCPWCYLGRRRLERAITRLGQPVSVTFRAFQLDPSPVPNGVPIKEALAAQLGDRARAEHMFAHVTAIAAGDGLALDFGRAIAANTFDAHRLLVWAAGQQRQVQMLEVLQRAHFSLGLDIGSRAVLAELARSIGLDATAYLASEAGTGAVEADLAEARELGITSVPFLMIDGKYAVQGAQAPETLVEALTEIARREALDAGFHVVDPASAP